MTVRAEQSAEGASARPFLVGTLFGAAAACAAGAVVVFAGTGGVRSFTVAAVTLVVGGVALAARRQPRRRADDDGETAAPARDEVQELKKGLAQVTRVTMLGQVAGGVVHDFNNQLSVILTNASLVRDAPGLDPQARADLDEIVACGRRAAELTSQLLALTRRARSAPEDVDVAATVRSAEKLLRRLLPANVKLELHQAPAPPVWVDAGDLLQSLFGLVAAARDAQPAGGSIVVEVRVVEGTTALAVAAPGAVLEVPGEVTGIAYRGGWRIRTAGDVVELALPARPSS